MTEETDNFFLLLLIDGKQNVTRANRKIQRPYQRLSRQTSFLQKSRSWCYQFGFRHEKETKLLNYVYVLGLCVNTSIFIGATRGKFGGV